MNPIVKFFRFLVKDTKGDIDFLRNVKKEEFKPKYTLAQLIDIRPLLKEGWVWLFFLIIVLAFASAWYVSAIYHQHICNTFIIENYLNRTITEFNNPLNLTIPSFS